MAFTCDTNGFPWLSSYAEARKHFDSVKPWRSKYNPHDAERPIGQRAVKRCGERFNKAMRELDDGSIAFRLYGTDCVIWHPDNKLTIRGWDTVSTSAFVNGLVPSGVTHMRGRKDAFEPCLHLQGSRPQVSRLDWYQQRPYWQAYWRSGQIVQCSRAVTLDYNADADGWLPVEPDALEPFTVPVLDRKALYRASRKYHLPTLVATIDALAAMATVADRKYHGYGWVGQAMSHLADGQIMSAVELLPRNRGGSVDTSAIRVLRNRIYSDEGVVTRVNKRSLTPAEYRRYVAQSKIYF